MDWSKGYMSKCYVSVVNESSWLDGDRFEITGGSIRRTDSDLMESADLDCTFYPYSGERWVRIWMDVIQGGDSSREALFTGLATSPDRNIDGTYETNQVQCYSVLKPPADVLMPLGWYAPAESIGAELARDLLSVTPAPIFVADNSPKLTEAIIAESGETNLSMALAIIYSIGWELRIDGLGNITIAPPSDEVVASFDSTFTDIVEPKLTVSFDWFNCPNVLRVIAMDGTASIAKDESDNSIFSIQNRGREVWVQEGNPNINPDETLNEYTQRRLSELQRVNTQISYDRRYIPNINVGDRVRFNYPAQNIIGDFIVTNQTITLGYNATTSEEALLI